MAETEKFEVQIVINYIFNYSKITLMVEEMDIKKEINQSEQKTPGIFKVFFLIPHLRIYKLPAAFYDHWFSKGPQAISNVLSEICFRGRFTC